MFGSVTWDFWRWMRAVWRQSTALVLNGSVDAFSRMPVLLTLYVAGFRILRLVRLDLSGNPSTFFLKYTLSAHKSPFSRLEIPMPLPLVFQSMNHRSYCCVCMKN